MAVSAEAPHQAGTCALPALRTLRPRARVRGGKHRPLVGYRGDGMLFARVLPACHSARSAGNAHGLSGAVLAFLSRPARALTDASRRGVSPYL
jgi:hypothetical protein